MRTEMPTATCENDATEKVKMTTANISHRTTARFPFMTLSLFPRSRPDKFTRQMPLCPRNQPLASLRSSLINTGLRSMLRTEGHLECATWRGSFRSPDGRLQSEQLRGEQLR